MMILYGQSWSNSDTNWYSKGMICEWVDLERASLFDWPAYYTNCADINALCFLRYHSLFVCYFISKKIIQFSFGQDVFLIKSLSLIRIVQQSSYQRFKINVQSDHSFKITVISATFRFLPEAHIYCTEKCLWMQVSTAKPK